MNDLLQLFATFVRTVDAGSFTAVARQLQTTQPTISRQIAALEEHLGCQLLHRTTRALSPTEDGRVFYERARATLDSAAEAESAVGKRNREPSGVLRLACSGVFGRLHVIPRLTGFQTRYPKVQVVLSMRDAFVDLVEDGIDLAFRIGNQTDSSLVARRIGLSRRVVVATRGYLERHGRPSHPSELEGHSCVVYDRLSTGANWSFSTPEGPLSVPVDGRLHVDSTEGVRTAVLEGIGIGYVPVWHFIDREIESGQVEVLLKDFETPVLPIQGLYPSRKHLALKVRVALDHFATEFALDRTLWIEPK